MPDYQFTFTVQNITPQKATAIRDRMAQRLGDDQVTVAASGMAQTTSSFRVIGVDTATKQVFDQTVDAPDKQSAQQRVVGSSSTMVVAVVREAAG